MLYIVATPIGNLKDITFRAVEVLGKVDMIAAEDTRRTRILGTHYNIKTPVTSYFEHNKVVKGEYLLRLLKEGKDVALVSDSGMPGISDPGYSIIRLAIENNIPVTVAPGASAITAAIVLSGMPSSRFVFEGFLSHKKCARRKKLEELKNEVRTMVFYESPHRLLAALNDIYEILGDRAIGVVRELTKVFEEVKRGPVSEILEHFQKNKPRGEFVLVVKGAEDVSG
jgi:16S rRNA (cytidine1402-2'-O)-methyltransferase